MAVYNRNGELALFVEVKGRSGTSAEWAAQLLRNMYSHGELPPVPYFLLVLPDRLYLWRDVRAERILSDAAGVSLLRVQNKGVAASNPDFTADAAPIFTPYLDRMRAITGTEPTPALLGRSLEMMVANWLDEVVSPTGNLSLEQFPWLEQSGLWETVRGGQVEMEAFV